MCTYTFEYFPNNPVSLEIQEAIITEFGCGCEPIEEVGLQLGYSHMLVVYHASSILLSLSRIESSWAGFKTNA